MKIMQIHDTLCLMFNYSICMSGVCVQGGGWVAKQVDVTSDQLFSLGYELP